MKEDHTDTIMMAVWDTQSGRVYDRQNECVVVDNESREEWIQRVCTMYSVQPNKFKIFPISESQLIYFTMWR